MAETITYSELVTIFVKQINKLRDDPSYLLPVLDKRLLYFDNNNYKYEGNQSIKIQTEEGDQPVKQVIAVLSNTNRLPSLKWSYPLHCVANKRAKMLARNQGIQQNLIRLEDLLKQEFQFTEQVSQHFVYGYCDPIDIICSLLIDDGNPDRQNRVQMLNPLYTSIGIGIEEHDKYRFVVVVVLASRIEAKKDFSASQLAQNILHYNTNESDHNNQVNAVFVDGNADKSAYCQNCSIY